MCLNHKDCESTRQCRSAGFGRSDRRADDARRGQLDFIIFGSPPALPLPLGCGGRLFRRDGLNRRLRITAASGLTELVHFGLIEAMSSALILVQETDREQKYDWLCFHYFSILCCSIRCLNLCLLKMNQHWTELSTWMQDCLGCAEQPWSPPPGRRPPRSAPVSPPPSWCFRPLRRRLKAAYQNRQQLKLNKLHYEWVYCSQRESWDWVGEEDSDVCCHTFTLITSHSCYATDRNRRRLRSDASALVHTTRLRTH